MVSSAYLKLFIFLPPILTPMSSSSWFACLMMYSLYRLNRYGERTHPCLTPFPIEKLSVSPYSVRTFKSSFRETCLSYCHFLLHLYIQSVLNDIQHTFACMRYQGRYCPIVWAYSGISFFWYWYIDWLLPLFWPDPFYPNLLAYCC